MNFRKNLQLALRALAANKMRAGLTMLGVMIGVGAVVALMALGNGASETITGQVQGIGVNLVMVLPGRFDEHQSGPPEISYMYYEDYEALDLLLDNTSAVAPEFQGNGTVTYADARTNTSIIATSSEYAFIRSYEVARGRFIVESDRSNSARVAVLGNQTATNLFGAANPVGRQIKINNVPFEVIGVLAEKGVGQDSMVIVPLETAYDKLLGSVAVNEGKRLITSIMISAATPDDVDRVMVDAERILRRQHGLNLSDKADFTVFSQEQFLDTLKIITSTLTAFLAAIAAISLVVGGIGIMNIMLVSVTERTREIGLRKALGAKRRTILAQFLIETVTLSVFGGILGILLGFAVAAIVTAADLIDAQVTIQSVLLAFGFSVTVGVVSGLYPAYRASRLRPIDALRYE